MFSCIIRKNQEFTSKKFYKDIKTKKIQGAPELLDEIFRYDIINLANCNPICAENITIHSSSATEDTSIATVKFTEKLRDPNRYGMMKVQNPFGNDWSKFYDFGGEISFDIEVLGGITVLFELKSGDDLHPVIPVPEFNLRKEHFSFQKTKISKDAWVDVREICFTVKDTTASRSGKFTISNLKIVYPKSDD